MRPHQTFISKIGFTICAMIVLAAVPFTLHGCGNDAKQPPVTHARVFASVANPTSISAPTLDTTGLRCILHTTTGTANVDSCSVVATAVVVPPSPPAPPPPPTPPPVSDTIVASVKSSPSPVVLAIGKTFQEVGGAYNAAGKLIPGAGYWVSANPGLATVSASGLVTAVAPTSNVNIEFHYGNKITWTGVNVTGTVPPPPPPTSGGMATADSFTRSVGVGTHFSYFDLSPYSPGAKTTALVAQIKALGVYFVRDGVPYSTDKNWSNTAYAGLNGVIANGEKVLFVVQPKTNGDYSSTNDADTAIARLGSGLLALEGPNEVDNNNGNWGGLSAYSANVKTFQCASYAKAHAAGVTMTSPTTTSGTGAGAMADLSACSDAAAIHPYPGGVLPTSGLGGAEGSVALYAKNKPFWITETGYYTLPNATQDVYQPGVSELAAAKYITREYLDYFSKGVVHSSTYELIDERVSTTDAEQNYGLLHNDGSPKAAYTALRTMLAAVRDTSAQSSSPQPTFSYSLSGASGSVRTIGLAKRNGQVDVLLWNDVLIYDVSGKKDITNASVPVTIKLTKTPSKVTALYPVQSSAPSPIASALSFQVLVTDSPLIVEITP